MKHEMFPYPDTPKSNEINAKINTLIMKLLVNNEAIPNEYLINEEDYNTICLEQYQIECFKQKKISITNTDRILQTMLPNGKLITIKPYFGEY